MAQHESGTVHAILMQEAQAEIASLRTDLYNTRRTSEERRQAVVALTAARDQLQGQVASMEAGLKQAHAELSRLHGVEAQLAALQETTQRLQRELEVAVGARRILQDELADERRQRQHAEQAKAALESERSRLQKARDEHAAQARVAQKAAREAEEEQLHAEAEAAALRAEVAALRAAGAGAAAAGSPLAPAAAPGSMGPAEAAMLVEQLEHERARGAALLNSLHVARTEADALRASAKAAAAQQQQPQQQQHGWPTDVAAVTQQLQQARAEVDAAHARLQQLEQQLQATASELAAVRQAAEASASASAPNGLPPRPPAGGGGLHHRHASSSDSLSTLMHASASGGGGRDGDLAAELQRYQAQVARLKHSRDKLLEEIDSQWQEMDRLAGEQRAAAEDAAAQRRLAAAWEAQAQDALAQIDRLKELLEESAAWGAGARGGAPGGAEAAAAMATRMLQEKARAAEIELGARALAAELARAQHASVSIGRSVLPVLCGIEHRLEGMCGQAVGALQQWRAEQEQLQQQQLQLLGAPPAVPGEHQQQQRAAL